MLDEIRVTFALSKDVNDYYKDRLRSADDWSNIANKMLQMYDITALPPTREEKYTQRTVFISDQNFINLYNEFGPKNKKCSLSRLFQFGRDCDIFALPEFAIFAKPTVSNKTKKIRAITATIKELTGLLAIDLPEYNAQDDFLREVKEFLWTYREMLKEYDNSDKNDI